MYKEIWEASCGQVFPCLREVGNAFDPFAVSVVRDSDIISHVPRKISATCSLFLRNRGTVKCTVTGTRQFSRDLAQGGLEIPCQLTFEGEKKYIKKVQFSWMENNHEIHENLNPSKLNTLTVICETITTMGVVYCHLYFLLHLTYNMRRHEYMLMWSLKNMIGPFSNQFLYLSEQTSV